MKTSGILGSALSVAAVLAIASADAGATAPPPVVTVADPTPGPYRCTQPGFWDIEGTAGGRGIDDSGCLPACDWMCPSGQSGVVCLGYGLSDPSKVYPMYQEGCTTANLGDPNAYVGNTIGVCCPQLDVEPFPPRTEPLCCEYRSTGVVAACPSYVTDIGGGYCEIPIEDEPNDILRCLVCP